MSHDTSRHTTRSDVICSMCGRTLRGALNNAGNWIVNRHNRPEGGRCNGHIRIDHAQTPQSGQADG